MHDRRDIAALMSARLLSAILVASALAKLLGAAGPIERFSRWGYPEWFTHGYGAVELALGLLLLWPRATGAAAVLVVPLALGGVFVRAVNGEIADAFVPAALLALAMWTAWASGEAPREAPELISRGDA